MEMTGENHIQTVVRKGLGHVAEHIQSDMAEALQPYGLFSKMHNVFRVCFAIIRVEMSVLFHFRFYKLKTKAFRFFA